MYTAKVWRRVIAYIIDKGFYSLFFLPVWFESVLWSIKTGQWKMIGFDYNIYFIISCFLFHLLYKVIFLNQLGGTLGKLLLNLRLVDQKNGNYPSLIQSLVRSLTDELSFILFGEGLRVLIFLKFDRTHVSDWLAETQVKQFRENTTVPRPHVFLAFCLSGYLSVQSFLTAYDWIQRSEIGSYRLIIYSDLDLEREKTW